MPRFHVLADYHQVLVCDEPADADFSQAWTPEAVRLGLAIRPDALALATYRNVTVPVTVEILAREPQLDSEAWDRVVQGSIVVAGKALVVWGPSDLRAAAPRLPTAGGTYRFRACSAGRETVSADGLDGADHYLVSLWRGRSSRVTAVRVR